jgi:hypothetical protein
MIVAATGHRPKDLPCKYNLHHPWKNTVEANLVKWLKENNPEIVLTGMAIGCDKLLALYNGRKRGGTFATVDYCTKFYPNKQIINFWK